jgi:acyl carrier protein
MSNDEVLSVIREALRGALPDRAADFDGITFETELVDLRIGSLSTMEVIGSIEDRMATTFRREDLARITRLGDIASLMLRAGAPDDGG